LLFVKESIKTPKVNTHNNAVPDIDEKMKLLITGGAGFIGTNFVNYWLDKDPRPVHRFHHVSTDEVCGTLTPDAPPFTVTTAYGMPPTPHTPPAKLPPTTWSKTHLPLTPAWQPDTRTAPAPAASTRPT
jgi:hypothetical protein